MNQGRPLAGIRVMEIAAYISGPYSGALLAALGADVIKVEPLEGEAFRIGQNTGSPFFAQYNAGKRSVAANLKSPEVIKAIKALLPSCDVLIENMRPGKLAQLGLGRDVCLEINPRLIYTSISGFGSGGPWVERPAYDSIGQALGGLYTIMNDPDDVRLTGTCMADLITAVSTSIGILAALVGRERSADKRGTHVETSVLEAVTTMSIDALTQALTADIDPVRETRHPQAQNFCLRTASGDYIVMHLSSSQKFWKALAKAVGRDDLIEDPRYATYAARVIPENYRAVVKIMQEEFAKQPASEWERRLIEADVPFAPAVTMRQLAAHPQVQWLDLLESEKSGHPLVRPPWRFDGSRPDRSKPVPAIGEHTREVLGEVLSPQQLDALADAAAIPAVSAAEPAE